MDRKAEDIKPLISIIIPNYNDDRIKRNIKSILDQDFDDYELIVIEGCVKNDKTSSIYKEYNQHISKLIHESDNGIFDALNKGIKASTGEFILLIGSDDKLNNTQIFSAIKNEYELNKNVNGFSIECHFINSKDKVIRKWIPGNISKNKIKWGILPPHFSLFLRKNVYDELGLFNLSEGNIGLDSKWLLRLSCLDEIRIPIIYNHAVLMQVGGTSTGSLKNILIAYKNIAKEARRMGLWNWPLIPFIKIVSKLPQFKIYL